MFKASNWIILILIVYVVSYAVLSVAGEYEVRASGKAKLPLFGIHLPDGQQWQPKGVRLTVYKNQDESWDWNGNAPGLIYAPLVLLDRQFWHPDKDLLEE